MIALVGRKRTGKDTAANYMVQEYGVEKRSIAAPLKRLCQDLFPLSDEQVDAGKDTPLTSQSDLTPRMLLQAVGQRMKRVFGPSYWVDQVVRHDTPMVVADVRFQEEIDALRRRYPARPCLMIKIERDAPRDDAEAHVDDLACDETIDNNGTPQDLHDAVDRIMTRLKYSAKQRAA